MELLMSIKTKIAALALAALAVTGSMAATTTKAEAYPINNWGWGFGAGLATAAIVGTAVAASNGPVYYTTYRRCGLAPRYNAFGQYMYSVRVCNF